MANNDVLLLKSFKIPHHNDSNLRFTINPISPWIIFLTSNTIKTKYCDIKWLKQKIKRSRFASKTRPFKYLKLTLNYSAASVAGVSATGASATGAALLRERRVRGAFLADFSLSMFSL